MKKSRYYFARFWSPGVIVGESWDEEVSKLDPKAVRWPASAYCFSLYEREDVLDDNGTRFRGKARKVGPTYYHPDSEVVSAAKVMASKGSRYTETLKSNVRVNEWTHIVWSRWGNWPQPFNPEEDVVLEPTP